MKFLASMESYDKEKNGPEFLKLQKFHITKGIYNLF